MNLIQHQWWETSVTLRENEDEPVVRNFTKRELALAAVQAAMSYRFLELGARRDVCEIRDESCGINDDEHFNMKITWWKKTEAGYVAQKDYFSVRPREFELTIEA